MQEQASPGQEGAAPPTEGGAGGLPQFDIATWPGQAAWFLIFFVIVLVLMSRVFVPRIGGGIAEREGKISGDLRQARQLKDEADAQAAAAHAETSAARAQAIKVAGEARTRAQAELAARLAEQDAKVAQSSAEAEARIGAARDAAMSHIDEIANDAAKAIVTKLTGKAPSAAELAAAGRA
jgi:F-type H+-transporting ATPase subunit b